MSESTEKSKRKSEASRLFIGGKSILDRFPELAWVFEPVGREINQMLEWSSFCVTRRYKDFLQEKELGAIDLKELNFPRFAQKKLHDAELNTNLASELPFQVKMGILTSDHVDKNKVKKADRSKVQTSKEDDEDEDIDSSPDSGEFAQPEDSNEPDSVILDEDDLEEPTIEDLE